MNIRMCIGMCVCGVEVEERWCMCTKLRLSFGLHVLGVAFHSLATLNRYMMYYLTPETVPNLRLDIPNLHAVSVPSSDRHTTTQGSCVVSLS